MKRLILGSAFATFAVGLVAPGVPAGADRNTEIQALLQADRDFAAATAERGGEGWADSFAADGIMFLPHGRLDGRDSIRETMVPAFAGDVRLRWDPVSAVVSESGDLGYTLGRWEQVRVTEGAADSTLSTGSYVSIWKKVKGEGWKVAVDIGNSDS